MRTFVLKPKAKESLYQAADWISGQNSPDTGQKFVDEFTVYILKYCELDILKFPPCKNGKLARRKLSCLVFKRKWIIAFKYSDHTLTVHEFIWGGKLR